MSLSDDLATEVAKILRSSWTERDGREIPDTEDIQLGNDAINLDCTVLYADLADSTNLVNNYKPTFAAEVYKCYLHCASKIIADEGGGITAFDGDRVMGVFIGDTKNSTAARCALKINHSVEEIIRPAIAKQYTNNAYVIRHAVGVDTSKMLVARTGIRGSNDLVWVGRAANYAAKLCALRSGNYASWITTDVFNRLRDDVKYGGPNNQLMWESHYWSERSLTVYKSTWYWKS